jgi:nicotinic acid mononucleotide adenylyltransferase
MSDPPTLRSLVEQLQAARLDATAIRGGLAARSEGRAAALMPGAFNPLHEGHRQMAKVASEMLGEPLAFEISINNVDKRDLHPGDLLGRLGQFQDGQTVWLTRADTFVKKARIFPGATFVVGADTILRVGHTQYYGNERRNRDESLCELHNLGIRFLVFGRITTNRFCVLDELDIPLQLRELCTGVTESDFRNDISSSELRRKLRRSV